MELPVARVHLVARDAAKRALACVAVPCQRRLRRVHSARTVTPAGWLPLYITCVDILIKTSINLPKHLTVKIDGWVIVIKEPVTCAEYLTSYYALLNPPHMSMRRRTEISAVPKKSVSTGAFSVVRVASRLGQATADEDDQPKKNHLFSGHVVSFGPLL